MYSNSFTEDDVRNIANEYLSWHYRNSKIIGDIYTAKTEEKTKKGKFPDGFHAFRRTHNTICVVTLECKRELDSTSLGFKIHPERLIKRIFITASFFHVLFFMIWFEYNQFFGIYLEPLTFVLSLLLFLFLYSFSKYVFVNKEPKSLLIRNIFYQLEQYPGDEQWLAFSTPTDNKQQERFEAIKKDCRRKGIGLLMIDMNALNTTLEEYPRPKTRQGFSYLTYYAKEEEIYNQLMETETAIYHLNRRTPAQKRQYWKWISATILITCIVSYFRLDFNNSPIMATKIEDFKSDEDLVVKEITEIIEKPILLKPQKVLLDNSYNDKASAEFRVKRLEKIGVKAIFDNKEYYDVDFNISEKYFVFIEDDENGLLQIYHNYQKALLEADLPVIDAELITLVPKL